MLEMAGNQPSDPESQEGSKYESSIIPNKTCTICNTRMNV
jgi:hypothetical protein